MKNLQLTLTFFITSFSILCSQSELILNDCSDLFFGVNNATSNPDNPCSTDITLEQMASYSSIELCAEDSINWVVFIDLWNDGVYDIEFNSNLPSIDTTNDDTNGNSIPDYYISPTVNGAVQQVKLLDIDGGHSKHRVYWKAEDACGVNVTCIQEFLLVDTQPPVPYCVNLSTFVLSPDIVEYAEGYAEDFMIYPFDNCTPQDELRFSFSGDNIVPTRHINCDDVINSPVEIDVYVWDNQDNVNYCTVLLTVLATETVDCYEVPMETVEGFVKTEEDEPIENAEVFIYCNLPEYPRSVFTDANGYYSFINIPFGATGCYLEVDKDDEYIEDVSTLDLVKIMRHILGIQTFTTPYQVIASDVSGDQKVKSSDLIVLRKLILGIITEFPTDSPWIFIDENFNFSNPDLPWIDLGSNIYNPQNIMLSPMSNGPYDFIGVKRGDIND